AIVSYYGEKYNAVAAKKKHEEPNQSILNRFLGVQQFFFSDQSIYGFNVGFIRNAAIYRAYRSALWFFMKTLAFCAFVCNNVIGVNTNRSVFSICINRTTIQ